MAIIAAVGGSFCHGEDVIAEVSKRLGNRRIDNQILDISSKRYNVERERLLQAVSGSVSFLDRFSREREKNLVYLETVLAELLISDDLLVYGYPCFMIPGNISHILKVCIIASQSYRINQAVKVENIQESEAISKIQEYDKEISFASNHFLNKPAYDESLYDMVIPMQSTSIEEAAEMIFNHALSDALKTTERSRRAADDFLLGAKVKLALTLAGHDVNVFAENGHATILINEHAIRMAKLESKLKRLALDVPGVEEVTTKLGPKFATPSLNPWERVEVSPKILLVDDEKEFVQTLSERLKTRNLESSIAYDGEQALEMLGQEIPDVIVLDLMMPGIDGIETLRRIKESHPEIEVIILTGHGSDTEQDMAEELGAFAYLRKPVNINELARKMREAYSHSQRK